MPCEVLFINSLQLPHTLRSADVPYLLRPERLLPLLVKRTLHPYMHILTYDSNKPACVKVLNAVETDHHRYS
jgi:hypothetical protein